MSIKTLVAGPLDVNAYILYGRRGNEAAVIDPADAQPVLDFLQKEGLLCTKILLTHGHFDHFLGVPQLKRDTGAEVLIQEKDAGNLQDAILSLALMCGSGIEPFEADKLVHEGDIIDAAGFALRVIETPGHTPGGVCYVLEDEKTIFTGDTLFRLSIGRSDFPGSDPNALLHAIQDKLFALEGNYTVYPGHMGQTDLDKERRFNPFLNRT